MSVARMTPEREQSHCDKIALRIECYRRHLESLKKEAIEVESLISEQETELDFWIKSYQGEG